MVLKVQRSEQYITKSQIIVTILDVVNPAEYVIKEAPVLNASSEAKNFLEAEESMQKYYASFESCFFQLPLKDSIIVVLHEKKFYRARVIKILNLSAGHLFKVYLVDYGVECSVNRDCIYKIEKDFLDHPFQAVNMKLIGIEPVSLVMNSTDMSMSYGSVSYWDPSAEIFVHDMLKAMCNAYIEVKAIDDQYIYGSIFMCFEDNTVKCVNEELVSHTFAQFDDSCWEKVHKIEDVLENNISITSPEINSSASDQKDTSAPSYSSSQPELDFKVDFTTTFIRPSDGKVVAKSSFAHDSLELSYNFQEDSSESQSQEKSETMSPFVLEEKSTDQKAIAIKRLRALQNLNRKRNSSPGDKNNETVENCHTIVQSAVDVSSIVRTDKIERPDQPCIAEMEKYCNRDVTDNISINTNSENFSSTVICAASAEESKSEKIFEAVTPVSNRVKKLQELRRKRQTPPSGNNKSADTCNTSNIINKPEKTNVSKDSNLDKIEDKINCDITNSESAGKFGNSDDLKSPSVQFFASKDTSCVAAVNNSLKPECAAKAEIPPSNKIMKLQELHRRRQNNTIPSNVHSTDIKGTCILKEDLSDVLPDKTSVYTTIKSNESFIDSSTSNFNPSSRSCDNPVSKVCSTEIESSSEQEHGFQVAIPASKSKFQKLQELHKKRQKSEPQRDIHSEGTKDKTDVGKEHFSNSTIVENSPFYSNVDQIPDSSDCNIVNSIVASIFCDSDKSKLYSVQPRDTRDSDCLEAAKNSSKQENNSSEVATPASKKKFQKLQELHKKRQKSEPQSNIHFEGTKDLTDVGKEHFCNSAVVENVPCYSNVDLIQDSSDCNIENSNVASISCDSDKSKLYSVQLSDASKFDCLEAVNISSKQEDNSSEVTAPAPTPKSKFQKLQELHKKRQNSVLQCKIHSKGTKDITDVGKEHFSNSTTMDNSPFCSNVDQIQDNDCNTVNSNVANISCDSVKSKLYYAQPSDTRDLDRLETVKNNSNSPHSVQAISSSSIEMHCSPEPKLTTVNVNSDIVNTGKEKTSNIIYEENEAILSAKYAAGFSHSLKFQHQKIKSSEEMTYAKSKLVDNFTESKSDISVSATNISQTKTIKNIVSSPSSQSQNNVESDSLDSSPMQPKQSQILNEMLNMSDSDDILCSISMKKNEKICDNTIIEGNYIELSTQLQHSDLRLMKFNEMSLWEKQKVPALLIGLGLISPVLNVDEANFSDHAIQILKEIKFYGPSCIQSVIWPSVEKNRCMVAVAPPHSGKTVSYVLPLVSSYTKNKEVKPHDNGPAIIILCSSWLKAQAVYDFFYFFLENKKMNIITLCTEGGHYRNRVISLINSCDVLIATPYCLLQFLKSNSIKFTRLENFILDDTTTMMNKHKKELKNILLNYMSAVKWNHSSAQLMLFAERWNKNFHLILDKIMSNPLIFFTSFLESALYAKVPIFAHICKLDGKKDALLDIVAKEVGHLVICTTNKPDAVDVHHFLRCEDVRSFLVNEEMEHYIADEVIKDWKSINSMSTANCLVITDQALIKMSISHAICLVHFDIPPESRLQFGNRFSCIAEHFQTTNPPCVSHILVAESDYHYASQIAEIIENSGGIPSNELKDLSKMEDEIESSSDLLCPYFKAFGFCKERLCKNRHSINTEKDKPQIVPFEGDIQGLVTQIVDASHYYVRLLKYLDPVTSKTVSLISTYAELGFQLRDFYCSASGEMKVESPVVGESYVLAEENNLYYRIKVLKEIHETPSTLPSWKILFLDEGWIKCYEKPELYKLSDQLQLPEPLAVEVYVCNITTPDSCPDWNPQTSQLVADLIKGKEVHGKIVLCLGRTLWLDPVALVLHLPSTNEYINLFKLNQKLMECGHARHNKNHLINLLKAATGKVPLPHLAKPAVKEEEKVVKPIPTISYAFLECNKYEDVYVSSVKSPHQFYVQRAKFVQCLDDLLDKMNEQIENRMLRKAFTLYKGMHCIAPFYEDDRYYRAVITDVCDTEVHLFYVDFGDTGKAARNNIYSLPAEFLLLPFQAIECELAGIAAAHGGWTDSSVDALTTLTRDEAGDMKILQLKAYIKTSCYEGGNHYVIDLWFNEKNLSEQLLQAGLGIPVELPEITEVEPSMQKSLDSTPEQSSEEEFDLNERKLSSDEDMHPVDKDTTALFYNYVAEMVMQANNLIAKPGVTITEVSSDDEKSNINKNDKLVAQKACKDLVKLLPKINKVDTKEASAEPCSKSLRPLITWWDTPEQISILIKVKDVKMYQLMVTDEGFSFNTIIAGVQYSTDEKLYDAIHSSDARKYQTIQGINIVAKKHTPFKWSRLTKEKKKFLHIKYDLIHIDDSDTDEQSAKIKKQVMGNEYAMDEESSSTDEDEKYVEPWKDFAQQMSPLSKFD